ncbi:N-acetylmuramoyl-L-alanine amidase family protein [Allorhizocola rhizosphaerae]|uniref:N-acetylmuramoyl-L-alanine amidase family protein n=1 Tax=Allorhizocola rhizosphaerae TaxID=1872709 RepID=UPI000E3CAAAC|nr:N-acetylmuramoyl-L-alanine amidase [Allorhizocola rhizosphaerae]
MTSKPLGRRTILATAAGLAVAPWIAAGTAHAAVPKIYIDPGHGGTEPGAVANGLQEKNLTLNIALQVRNILTSTYGSRVSIRMSRTTDVTRSLTYRTDDANAWGADIFVSIHCNAGGGTGFESFRYPGTAGVTLRLHSNVHSRVLANMRTIAAVTDRGMKTANFHVLRETVMPAVLTENLFVDRLADANLLKRADFLTATARGHAQGIAAHFGL